MPNEVTVPYIYAEIVRLHPTPPDRDGGGFLRPCTVPHVCAWCGVRFGLWRDDNAASEDPRGWVWRSWPHPVNDCLWSRAHVFMQTGANGLPR